MARRASDRACLGLARRAEDFSGLVNYRDETQPGARRFDVGERSNFALLPVVIAALEQLLDWQVERIAASIGALNDRIAARLATSGFTLPPPAVRSPHILGVAVPPGASDIVPRLAAQSSGRLTMRSASPWFPPVPATASITPQPSANMPCA